MRKLSTMRVPYRDDYMKGVKLRKYFTVEQKNAL